MMRQFSVALNEGTFPLLRAGVDVVNTITGEALRVVSVERTTACGDSFSFFRFVKRGEADARLSFPDFFYTRGGFALRWFEEDADVECLPQED